MTQLSDVPRGHALSHFVAGGRARALPDEVAHEARRALVDYLAVTVAAAHDPSVLPVRALARRWNAGGRARIVLGGTAAPAIAALINGTATHAMDFDDVHYLGAGHPGGPCWSTALALAEQDGHDEALALRAFVTGFEVMARLGGGFVPGVGRSLQRKGFHPTSVVGRMGAAAAASVLHGLEAEPALHALANAATTAGGIMASFGTHGKPFHAGKAAMDGILAADLAAEGWIGARQAYELEGGWLDAFIQDRKVEVPPMDFDARWELLRNGYKLFASCRATHASAEAAIRLAAEVARPIRSVEARIHPGAFVTAGRMDPQTALEAKFSVVFCVAMALAGYRLGAGDFKDAVIGDTAVQALREKVTLVPVEGQSPASAFLTATLEDGTEIRAETRIILGHPENPVSDAQLEDKFRDLVTPILGAGAERLLAAAWAFGAPGTLQRISAEVVR